MNVSNIFALIKARSAQIYDWMVWHLWAKLVLGALLLLLLAMIQMPLGTRAGIPTWVTGMALIVLYLMYCALTVYLHRKHAPWTVVQVHLPLGYRQKNGGDQNGPINVAGTTIYPVGSPEYNAQIIQAILMANERLPAGQRIPERVAINVQAMVQVLVDHPGTEQQDGDQQAPGAC